MTATLTKWYEEHGKHEIFAGGKHVPLKSKEHQLVLRDEIVTMEEQHDLDRLGIAKNAREEKIRARDAKLKEQQENARMMKLYKRARSARNSRDRNWCRSAACRPRRSPSRLPRWKSARKWAASETKTLGSLPAPLRSQLSSEPRP